MEGDKSAFIGKSFSDSELPIAQLDEDTKRKVTEMTSNFTFPFNISMCNKPQHKNCKTTFSLF